MIRAYSKKMLSPYMGQVQIVETTHARAITLDGKNWEIQFLRKDSNEPELDKYFRVAIIKDSELKRIALPSYLCDSEIDKRIVELADYIANVDLPLPAEDIFEYWLLDEKEKAPLALIFSCREAEQMATYPAIAEWTALPSSAMKVEATPDEEARNEAPVNYRFERLVAERAGYNPRAAWFTRRHSEAETFPSCLVSEEWEDEAHDQLCQRYIQRQAPRLLMLHWLNKTVRFRLEQAAKKNALEVERFCALYPEVVDEKLITAIRVEARLRRAHGQASTS